MHVNVYKTLTNKIYRHSRDLAVFKRECYKKWTYYVHSYVSICT